MIYIQNVAFIDPLGGDADDDVLCYFQVSDLCFSWCCSAKAIARHRTRDPPKEMRIFKRHRRQGVQQISHFLYRLRETGFLHLH